MEGPDDATTRAWSSGRAAHAGVDLSLEDFADHVSRGGMAWPPADDARAADLYLACACLRRVPRAAETFMTCYVERIPSYLRRRTTSAETVREVQQQLAVRFLVGDEGRPALLESYTGRGSLEGFVRIAAGRLAVDLLRSASRRPVSMETAVAHELIAEDIELLMLKEAYREPFRRAFAPAVAALLPDARALLRLHYVEGMTTEQLARLRKVGRATVVRRLADARDALVDALKDQLRAKVGIGDEEFDSLLRLVRSQLDLSLVRLLHETMT